MDVRVSAGTVDYTDGADVRPFQGQSAMKSEAHIGWFTVPVIKYKQKHFFIGPNVSAGYSIFNKKPDIMVGLGIGYRF